MSSVLDRSFHNSFCFFGLQLDLLVDRSGWWSSVHILWRILWCAGHDVLTLNETSRPPSSWRAFSIFFNPPLLVHLCRPLSFTSFHVYTCVSKVHLTAKLPLISLSEWVFFLFTFLLLIGGRHNLNSVFVHELMLKCLCNKKAISHTQFFQYQHLNLLKWKRRFGTLF